MRTYTALAILALLLTFIAHSQDSPPPQPHVVDPGGADKPPSDAVVLFNGVDLQQWVTREGTPTRCRVISAEMVCQTGDGDAMTIQRFRDAQIHVEFNVPYMPNQTDQLRGNSGVYVHGAWEVQILDSFENPTYPDGMLGSIYGFRPPLVNAARRPEEWQSYDITVRMPVCDLEGTLLKPARMTVLLNGVLIQDNTELDRLGPGHIDKALCDAGPLLFQDHGGSETTTMKFRNVWIREI